MQFSCNLLPLRFSTDCSTGCLEMWSNTAFRVLYITSNIFGGLEVENEACVNQSARRRLARFCNSFAFNNEH